MTDQDKLVRKEIESTLKSFSSGNISQNALSLFDALGYNTNRQNPFIKKTSAEFEENFGHVFAERKFNKDKAKFAEWQSVDLLFQLSRYEFGAQESLFDTKKVRWEGEDKATVIETYLFFAIELAGAEYTRTALAQITREVNKVFPMPVMIVFKHGRNLTFSIINRRLHKKDENKDVLEKVTLIKDIAIDNPHRAHIEILFDLTLTELQRVHKFTNFVELHNAWQKTLDTKELNKRFYLELSNWYFWAIHEVRFPGADMEADKSGIFQLEDKVREHNAKNLIRLLTRILFIWFIKEKNLIPAELFDEAYIRDNLINGFEPRKKSNLDYKTQGSKYYRAILQNLFFATLNQTVGKREFRKEGQQMNVTNLLRYESYFKNPKVFVKMVEDVVPFMNGGLFECLDSPDPVLKGKKGGDVIIYEDGFSDRKDNVLCVPDYIFFGIGEHADLSEDLGNKKQKDVTVSGLFNILKSYKFTVTENTPIEEDIALDPELLGRVFENLLASYNPETKTTARKQTGSFYTPREIVNYMVDESLKAYLKQKLETEADMKPVDAEVGLEFLIGYNEKEHLFDDKQTAVLINAIDNCKILDPACGSGAFPMGILHKLVHILHKLDPDNEKWRELQRQKAIKETEAAFQIGNRQEREDRLKEISDIFENNSDDYGRKLYLIENCIYGVDIQPIATQISKLRFFISLIVDQKSNKDKAANYGIRPLPNLETKFVAANTLIGIEKPQVGSIAGSLFDNQEVKILEEKIKDVRHRLFSAKTPSTKRKLREEDQNLREEMGKNLEDTGWSNESARQLAGWDPYNQNASSPFFDPEWMFGITDGFDVVIGNPPFITYYARRSAKLDTNTLRYYQGYYDFITDTKLDGKFNSIMFFLEKAVKLSKINSTTFYVLDIAFNDVPYRYIRKYLLSHTYINKIITGLSEFENVYSDQILLQFSKRQFSLKYNHSVSYYKKFNTESQKHITEQSIWLNNRFFEFNLPYKKDLNHIIKRMESFPSLSLLFPNKLIRTCMSLAGHEDEFILKNYKNKDTINIPVFNYIQNAKNLPEKYSDIINPEKVVYDENLKDKLNQFYRKDAYNEIRRQPKALGLGQLYSYLNPKIFVRQSADKIIATYTENKCAANTSFYIINAHDDDGNDSNVDLKYLLGVLNSKILTFYALTKQIIITGNKKQPQMMIKPFKTLPIPPSNDRALINIVDYILLYKKRKINTSYFEDLIDGMVYELYFPEEIKAADAEVLKHLANTSAMPIAGLPELKDEWPDEKKLAVIEKVYKGLSDPKHPVSIAMTKQKTIPEVRIIEGLDK
jgi:hypothetical protein